MYSWSSLPSHARFWGHSRWRHDPFPGGRSARHLGCDPSCVLCGAATGDLPVSLPCSVPCFHRSADAVVPPQRHFLDPAPVALQPMSLSWARFVNGGLPCDAGPQSASQSCSQLCALISASLSANLIALSSVEDVIALRPVSCEPACSVSFVAFRTCSIRLHQSCQGLSL